MKVIYMEANAEEMRANRSILDSMTEAFGNITRTIANVDVTPEMTVEAMKRYNDQTADKEDE